MSERILQALMHLFAIIAKIDEVSEDTEEEKIQSTKGQKIVEEFLKTELSSEYIDKYLNVFSNYLVSTRGRIVSKKKDRKRNALHSVKILRICTQINKELSQRQKVIVLVRIMEFILLDDEVTEREINFAETVAEAFHISTEEYERVKFFIEFEGKQVDDRNHALYLYGKSMSNLLFSKSEIVQGLDSPILIIYIESVRSIFFRYLGKEELYVNGRMVSTSKAHLFNTGSTVRTNKSSQIYYSDIITRFTASKEDLQLTFKVENVVHSFESGKNAIHKINICTNAGNLVGLMGESGSGKTTLLNIMNGKVTPKYGSIKINGIDLHEDKELLEGVIGNVSQDDLLIEELTVFENLFFSAKLSMSQFSKVQLIRKVNKLLR
ncbi:MAG TPA: ATP-binding cassette domain-containing protein, partial [Crocinitomicaceae bacterium]|nr:ATP-binding cassette domain-containing protein [Crocinitomicaceae bacterium]